MKCRYGVPEIFEDEAWGLLAQLYQDIKFVLKVPMVNFIFRVLAFYTDFLAIAWEQIRPNMLTENVEKAAGTLRFPGISPKPPPVDWRQFYAEQTIEEIEKTVSAFNYVNTKLLLIASAWAESLGNRPIEGGTAIQGYISPGVISSVPPIRLVQVCEAPPPVRNLMLDIQKKHRAMDVASDFRALANYPRFLFLSWQYLRPYVGSEEYAALENKLKEQSVILARRMPYPVDINREMLSAFYHERDIAGIMGVVSMFQNFLPGLIIDGEFFRRMLSGEEPV